jgi:hypothetical protein
MAKPSNYELRKMRSARYSDAPPAKRFRRRARTELLPVLGIGGYKQSEKAKIATQILNNLVMAGRVRRCIVDSRNTHEPATRLRVGIWNAVVKEGLAVMCLGSEASNKQTRYYATPNLLRLFKGWPLKDLTELVLERNSRRKVPTTHALVVLHTGKRDLATGKELPLGQQKQPLPLPDGPPAKCVRWDVRNDEDTIERINNSNLNHLWRGYETDPRTGKRSVMQPNACLKQIHSGKFNRTARLYSWGHWSGQGMRKEDRRSIRIDDEPVVELDYSGYATRMLYHFEEQDPAGDVYRPEIVMPRFYRRTRTTVKKAIVRDFVKRVTNICWNTKSRRGAGVAARNVLDAHEHREFLTRVIYSIEKTTASGIVDRVRAAHPDLDSYFFRKEPIGDTLMTIDGGIMLRILDRFARKGKAVLGIHDSVLCKASDEKFALRAMRHVYFASFGHRPVVKRAF